MLSWTENCWQSLYCQVNFFLYSFTELILLRICRNPEVETECGVVDVLFKKHTQISLDSSNSKSGSDGIMEAISVDHVTLIYLVFAFALFVCLVLFLAELLVAIYLSGRKSNKNKIIFCE